MDHNLCIDNKLTFYSKLSPKSFSIEDKLIKNKKKLVKPKKMLLNGVPMAHLLLIDSRNNALNRGNEYEQINKIF